MNEEFVNRILGRVKPVAPLGCCSSLLEPPCPSRRRHECVEIGFVVEHRFAFHYWIKAKQRLMYDTSRGIRKTDEEFQPPDLITWDWHDDTGGSCDYIEDELAQLNQRDEQEVEFFCWAGLRPINDGHIAPAIWLNAIGNVYVLQKQRDSDGCTSESRDHMDRYGRPRQIRYFRSPEEMAEVFEKTNSNSGVIWDVDMDYFTSEERVDDQPYKPMVAKRTIKAMLSPKKAWMPLILRDLKAVTIALEPKYTGGLTRSLEIYRTWESALLENPVWDKDCQWKTDHTSGL